MMTPRWSCRSTNFLVRRPITTWPFRTATSNRIPVNIVEVGPRDGLQNEKAVIPVDVKVDLINRLGLAGICVIEAGSFVSPKWVPQMAGTADVLTQMDRLPGVRYPVLVPNQKGLDNLLTLLSTNTSTPPLTTDVSVFTGSTDAFTLANTNTTVEASLAALAPVVQKAISHGLRVRGYVSVVITCPYSGRVDPERVREVAKALVDMGCYEVSLGDTVGTGTQTSVREMLDVVGKDIPMEKLAVHFHDTYGMGVANVLAALAHGVRTVDSSVGGLGGCPYSPGATGNVATEDVLYALQGSQYRVLGWDDQDVDVDKLSQIGAWISEKLGRDHASKAGKAIQIARQRT